MGMGGWISLAVIVAIVIWAIVIYNGLVAMRNRYKNSYAQIDVQLKRRYDLIQLVETPRLPPHEPKRSKGDLERGRGKGAEQKARRPAMLAAMQVRAGRRQRGALGTVMACSRPIRT